MDILIDSQKVVTVNPVVMHNEDDEPRTVLRFEDAHNVLTAWRDLDPARRNFRYGSNESDDSPSVIIIAWAHYGGGLTMTDIDPFFGRAGIGPSLSVLDTWNGYDLECLAAELPAGMLDWDRVA